MRSAPAPVELAASDQAAGAADFLSLMRRRERGRLKVYLGSAAGVGKTYRMLQEAHELRRRGVDVVVGFVETHGRAETAALVGDLEVVPRRRVEYRGVVLEDMDLEGVIARAPEVALVDELAHTNMPGLTNRKRWEDVLALLSHGANVISTLNVQHLESLNDVVARVLGVTVRETVPDWVVTQATQVVNVDLPVEDLRQRLVDGRIYAPEKVPAALANFFTDENLTTLRELALREVASSVDRSREEVVRRDAGAAPRTVDRIVVAMSSNPPYTRQLLRKASRIAGRLNADWSCVYVQTARESAARIDAAVQRTLVENIQLAQAMGAEVVKLEGEDVAAALTRFARARGATLVVVGQSRRSWWDRVRFGTVVDRLIAGAAGLDVLVVSPGEDEAP